MIKANELRIGNLLYKCFYTNGVEDRREIIDVKEIINDPVHWEANYEPISLTEEWLLKFGAEKLTSRTFRIFNYVLVYHDGEEYYQIGIQFPNSPIIHLANIKFVHQLQNLYFALTGEELKRNPMDEKHTPS